MNILGIACLFHDTAAVLVQDGIVTAAGFSRIEHDAGSPAVLLRGALSTGRGC